MHESRSGSHGNVARVFAIMSLLGCSADGTDLAGCDGDDMEHGSNCAHAASVAPPAAPQTSAQSPYANQSPSPIRGLSAQEYDDLQQGRGMGLARAAELNGYPGPRHVLDLSEQLQLDAAVASQIDSIFADMSAQARRLGAEVLAAEQALNQMFASDVVNDEQLTAQLASLGALHAELRGVHIRAHVAVRALLTGPQIEKYNQLRGYTTAGGHAMHHP